MFSNGIAGVVGVVAVAVFAAFFDSGFFADADFFSVARAFLSAFAVFAEPAFADGFVVSVFCFADFVEGVAGDGFVFAAAGVVAAPALVEAFGACGFIAPAFGAAGFGACGFAVAVFAACGAGAGFAPFPCPCSETM